jgi:hypothetical protein
MPKGQKDLKIGIPGCKTSLESNAELTLKSTKQEPRKRYTARGLSQSKNKDKVVLSSITLICELTLTAHRSLSFVSFWFEVRAVLISLVFARFGR